MSAWFLIIPILIPILGGVAISFIKQNELIRNIVTFFIVFITSIIVITFTFFVNNIPVIVLPFGKIFSFSLMLDGMGKMFSILVAILWPFATLYSFVYMKNEERKTSYTSFYTITYGVVLGLSFSANLISFYVFYEMLTIITLPLIIHTQTEEARRAGRTYLYFSFTGSAIALVGVMFLIVKEGSIGFYQGGFAKEAYSFAYLLTFLGFGVKAAVFPLCYWLPTASAAPTPTTALLHAVAVVKAGAFAIIRLSFFSFNPTLLQGTWAQDIAISLSAITIIYGAIKAVKETHFKRRLAYSTVANLSYILLGITLLTKAGLMGAMLHFIYHSFTKIALFFACGAIIKSSGAQYLDELNGLGKKMPIMFSLFTIAALSLTGIPLFAGFVSKWYLCMAAIELNSVVGYFGLIALIISSLLTAIYSLSIPIHAFILKPRSKPYHLEIYTKAKEPEALYVFTVGVFAILTIVLGISSTPLIGILEGFIGGIS